MRAESGATTSARLDHRRQNVLLAGLAVAYLTCLLFSDFLTRDANGMPTLWPMNAIVAAGLVHLTPARGGILWAIATLTGVISHHLAGDPWVLSLIYIACDGVEIFLASLIAARVTLGRGHIRSVPQALILIVAVLPLTITTAAVGSALTTLILGKEFWPFYRDWLFCTVLGMAIALPATLVILDPDRTPAARRKSPVAQAGLYGLVAAFTALAFLPNSNPMPLLIFPAAMLASFQLGLRGAAWSTVITFAIAAPLTVAGFGEQIGGGRWSEPDRIRLVQVGVASLFITCLAAALSLYREDRLKLLMARRSALAHAARARAQEASLAKTEFLATMSHEIRTPLNSILGFSNLLGATETLSDAGRRKLDLIAQAGDTLVTIVEDVLDFSRIDTGRVQLNLAPASPATLLRDTAAIVAPTAQAKGLSLTVDIRVDDAGLYQLDERRLRQVLSNLLNNAVKFTLTGGVTARLAIEAGPAGPELVIEVSDTGIGIAPELHDRLFQRFSQADGSIERSFGGVGLGLAICKALVSLMAGEIGLRSAQGRGSTFWMRIPAEPADQIAPTSVVENQGPVARILLVDDHPMNRELGRAMLLLAGCDVETAEDGHDAVRAAATGKFDLILMDIHMPRMDGVAASQAIRALPGPASAVPIIALSADVMPQQIERCRLAGMVDHVAKPIDREALYATINRWLAPDPLAA